MNVTSLIQVSDIKLSRTSAFSNPPLGWQKSHPEFSLLSPWWHMTTPTLMAGVYMYYWCLPSRHPSVCQSRNA